jgi:hypothetical protein
MVEVLTTAAERPRERQRTSVQPMWLYRLRVEEKRIG